MNEQKEKLHEKRRLKRHGFWAGIFLGGLLGALIAGGVAFSSSQVKAASRYLANPVHAHAGHGLPDPEKARERIGFATELVLGRVEATDEQIEQVKSILASTMDGVFPLAQQHQANREVFASELAASSVDRSALEQIRKAELELADQASSQLINALADVAEVLTPEQRTELLELAQRFHK